MRALALVAVISMFSIAGCTLQLPGGPVEEPFFKERAEG